MQEEQAQLEEERYNLNYDLSDYFRILDREQEMNEESTRKFLYFNDETIELDQSRVEAIRKEAFDLLYPPRPLLEPYDVEKIRQQEAERKAEEERREAEEAWSIISSLDDEGCDSDMVRECDEILERYKQMLKGSRGKKAEAEDAALTEKQLVQNKDDKLTDLDRPRRDEFKPTIEFAN